ncbi:conjugative transfer protein [Escherichia coli]|nr:conjugative transfer protein [Escherichia coli]
MVEEYCTRTASITGDWKYTDEYREVTIPHSQFRFSMNGLKTGVQRYRTCCRDSGKCLAIGSLQGYISLTPVTTL